MTLLAKDAIQEEVAGALTDAGFKAEQVLVHVHEREYIPDGHPSGHYRPRQLADAADALGLDDRALSKLNVTEAFARHRLVLYGDYGPEPAGRWLFAALVRHELEHAQQFEVVGNAAFELSQLIDTVHETRFGEVPEEKYLYRAKPDEQDANAAAATYLADRYPAALDILHTDAWYPLVWSCTRPEGPETLVFRSVCFLFQYVSVCEQLAADRGTSFAAWLEDIDSEAGALWRELAGRSLPTSAPSGGCG